MSRLIFLLVLLTLGYESRAQDPAPPVPPAVPLPAPPVVPVPPPAPPALPVPAVAQPAVPIPPATLPKPATAANPSADTVQLQFPNADVTQVLDYYERLTGRRLIRDNQVIGQVNIVINQPIPKEEAIKIMEINLLMNGFTLVPVDEKLWKVIGTGKNPRNFGIPILSDVEDLPTNTEQIVTYLVKLQYADPVELSQILGQAIPPSPSLGQTITPLPKAGALLITENSTIIRGILRIIREIDLPPAEVVSEFFTLERADSKDVLEKLQDIIQPKTQTGTPATPPAGIPRPAQNAQRGGVQVNADGLPLPQQATVEVTGPNTIEVNSGRVLSEDAVVVGKTILQADQRTNRIHIVTRPVNMKFFTKLIDQLDADTVFGEPVTRPLKFVSAGDIIQAMKQAISDPGAKEEGGAAGGTRPGQTNRGNTGNQQNLFDNNRSNQGGFGGGSGTGGFSESLSTEERDVVPEAFTVGNTRIIADKRANAIIVIGNKDVQQKVFAFLDKIDVRAPQVEIRTIIGTLALSDGEQFGFDYILRKGSDLGTVTRTTDANGNVNVATSSLVVNPGTLANPGGIPAANLGLDIRNLLTQSAVTQIATGGASGLSGFFTAGNALDAILTALTSTRRFKVNATPSIFTSNSKKAVISAGSEIAVPTSIQAQPSGTNVNSGFTTNSNIQFKTVALQLEVLPLINADGEVELDIVQKIDELTGESQTIDNNQIPTIATRVLKTNVRVPSGATIALGGLVRERDDVQKSGIPYLSKIPGLGALFRSTRKTKSRDELIILMRPVVTTSARQAIEQRERTMENFTLEPDLESSLFPDGTRRNVPPAETFRRAAPVLRENVATPPPKSSKKK